MSIAIKPQQYANWDESKHPRGQPENAGEFASAPASPVGDFDTWKAKQYPEPNTEVTSTQPRRGHELADSEWDDLHVSHRAALKSEDWDTVDHSVEEMRRLLVDKLSASLDAFPDQERAKLYRNTLGEAISQMSTKAQAEIGKNVKAVHFHQNIDDVTVARFGLINRDTKTIDPNDSEKLREVALTGPHRTSGMWTYSSANKDKGELHLDGGSDVPASLNRDVIQSDENTAVAIYRHELGHALDGRRVHSLNPEWMQAWSEEIRAEPGNLSKYAMTSTTEGWAEFARLVFSTPSLARHEFPKCWAYWKKQGFV